MPKKTNSNRLAGIVQAMQRLADEIVHFEQAQKEDSLSEGERVTFRIAHVCGFQNLFSAQSENGDEMSNFDAKTEEEGEDSHTFAS